MKKSIIILFSILSLNQLIGQHITFPDSNAIWSVYNVKYFVSGDTTINSLLYSKYYLSDEHAFENPSYYAALREDTLTQRVYYVPLYRNEEKLLYDFSLVENDTVSVNPYSFSFGLHSTKLYVESIDSILIGNNFRKRIKIRDFEEQDFYDEYWIEGIGSTFGIFDSGLTGDIVFDVAYPFLLCFELNEEIVFQNPEFESCFEYPPGVSTNDLFDVDITISPNPTSNKIMVNSEKEIQHYSVINQIGHEVIFNELNSSTFEIDLYTLPVGIYFIKFEVDDRMIVERVIKINEK